MALEEQFIQHLSKEIETHTTAMMTFRTKIGFIVFLGPYVLLGSLMVGTKGVPHVGQLSCKAIIALIAVALCYLGLSFVAARIEQGMWRHCNCWREQIAELVARQDVDPKGEKVQVSYKRLVWTYVIAFALFFLSLILTVFLMGSLFGS